MLDGAIETIELTSSGRVISLPAGSVKAPSASEEACPDDAETAESAAEVSESPETAAEAPEVSSGAASLTDETLWAAELSAEASDEPQPDRTAAVIADARTTLSNDFFIIFSSLSRFYLKDTNNGIFDFLWIHSHRNNRRSRNPFPAPTALVSIHQTITFLHPGWLCSVYSEPFSYPHSTAAQSGVFSVHRR